MEIGQKRRRRRNLVRKGGEGGIWSEKGEKEEFGQKRRRRILDKKKGGGAGCKAFPLPPIEVGF
jgi:hypothetical protein